MLLYTVRALFRAKDQFLRFLELQNIISRKDWKIKVIIANEKFESETLWCKITTPNSGYYAASIYYPFDPIYEPAELLKFSSDTCDQILHYDPNAKIVIEGEKSVESKGSFATTWSASNG